MFRPGWVATLRFAMSASKAPITVQQRFGVIIIMRDDYLSLAASIAN